MRNIKHEESLIRAFFLPGRQKRALVQLACLRKRSQFLNRLAHLGFDYLDERFVTSLQEEEGTVDSIFSLLKYKGAPKNCYIISQWKEIDCKEMLLRDALLKVCNSGRATLLSLIPGQLGYYEGEDISKQYLLFKSN